MATSIGVGVADLIAAGARLIAPVLSIYVRVPVGPKPKRGPDGNLPDGVGMAPSLLVLSSECRTACQIVSIRPCASSQLERPGGPYLALRHGSSKLHRN
jgi:hypothetical protein